MDTDIRTLSNDIREIKESLDVIKHILQEEYELSNYAKKQLKIARKTPLSKYVSHEEVKRRLLQ